jgi:hypothetical protein
MISPLSIPEHSQSRQVEIFERVLTIPYRLALDHPLAFHERNHMPECKDYKGGESLHITVDMHGMVCLYAFVPLCRLSLCYVSLICQFVSLPFLY